MPTAAPGVGRPSLGGIVLDSAVEGGLTGDVVDVAADEADVGQLPVGEGRQLVAGADVAGVLLAAGAETVDEAGDAVGLATPGRAGVGVEELRSHVRNLRIR